MKPVAWIDDSLERLREFPADAMDDAGYQLDQVQRGSEPRSWRPMPSIGLGVNEIRVQAGGAFRVIYVAKFAEAVYVIHVFQKKSQKTDQGDIELSRRRYGALLARRRQA
jgi:phage-related protein